MTTPADDVGTLGSRSTLAARENFLSITLDPDESPWAAGFVDGAAEVLAAVEPLLS